MRYRGRGLIRIEMEIEVISPPYLSSKSTRPVIDKVPAQVSYNATFTIKSSSSQDVESVSLLRPSSTTHTNNMDQRQVVLTIEDRSRDKLTVKAPDDASMAPTGDYMLFLANSERIPLIAKFLKIVTA